MNDRPSPHPRFEPDQPWLRIDKVLDAIPVRVFWKDLDGVYLGCNQLFAADAGLASPAEIIGKTDHELGWAEQADLYRADDRQVIESGVSKRGYEEPQTTPTGERIWLRTSKILLEDSEGRVVGILGTYEDITASKNAEEERRELQARVEHAQKLESLGILAGGIAHDFNNLLVAMLGHADLALLDIPPGTPGLGHIEEVCSAAERAAELTNQMLAYSGRGRFVVHRLDLNEVVGEMSGILAASIPKKVSLHRELAADLPAVKADVAQIGQVVMNLVTNAAEAIADAGRIVVRTGRLHIARDDHVDGLDRDDLPDGDYVFCEVIDDGCGMDDDTRRRLFEPFFTTKFQGRGLGLAAVQGIVRGHGGALGVESEPGRGTRFRILLPAVAGEPAESPTPERKREVPVLLGGTVLVVDDEETVRRVAGQMLEREGFDVLFAVDGADAVRMFVEHQHEITLVLLDMTMPRMDGVETFEELRAIDPDVRVILASGYNEQEATSGFVSERLAGFVQKPFTVAGLRARLQEALG